MHQLPAAREIKVLERVRPMTNENWYLETENARPSWHRASLASVSRVPILPARFRDSFRRFLSADVTSRFAVVATKP